MAKHTILVFSYAWILLVPMSLSAWDPVSVAVLSSGDVAILDSAQGILRVSDGTVRKQLIKNFGFLRPVDFTTTPATDGDSFLVSLKMGQNTNDPFTRLSRWNAAGKQTAEWLLGRPGGVLAGVAVDPARQVAYCADGRLGEVYQIDLRGRKPSFISIARIRNAGILGPLVFDPRGQRLLVADVAKGTIFAISLTGKQVDVLLEGGMVVEPQAMVFDADTDRLYIADGTKRRVWVTTTSGRHPEVRTFAGALKDPVGLALARDGKTLWVVDRFDQVLWQFAADGRIIAKIKL